MISTSAQSTDVNAPPLPPATRDGPKDTIESIIVAFILAFVFRAFVVEAFVIPTGSMAPTLYGKHGTMICESCGWEFAYGLLASGGRISRNSTARCPNCGFQNRTAEFYDASPPPSMESGDRILVLKWPFDIGGAWLGPQRWQVVVFKNPRDGEENFIKRLVGVPGEVLEIIDGDVYVAPVEELSDDARRTLEAQRRLKFLLRSKQDLFASIHRSGLTQARMAANAKLRALENEISSAAEQYERGRASLLRELDAVLRIARKPEAAQDALWYVVNDADYPFSADDPPTNARQWERATDNAKSHWEMMGRSIRFQGIGVREEAIELRGKKVDNFSGYNVQGTNAHRRGLAKPTVADLRIRCVVSRRDGDGYLRFALSKLSRSFWATLHADGRVTFHGGQTRRFADARLIAEGRIDSWDVNRPVELSFANVDYQLTLTVAGEPVLTTSWLREVEAGPPPNGRGTSDHLTTVAEIRRRGEVVAKSFPPSIAASNIDIDLTHLVVERDVFYTSPMLDQPPFAEYKLGGWGTMGNPILLREGEYFVLGDNSPQSADSRLWTVVGPHLRARGEAYQLGTVPADQLIGRAFFVYWPSGLRTDLIPGPLQRIGWIPNVGRMRWIR